MDDEAIRTGDSAQQDVSVATGAPEGEQQAPEASVDNEQSSTGPVSRRAAKMEAIKEARAEQAAFERREAWLMNNPEATEADYDSLLEEQARAKSQSGDSQDPPGEDGESAVGADVDGGTPGDSSVVSGDSPAANPPGWETAEDGKRYKTLVINGREQRFSEEEYDRMIQKDLAGDAKLQEASRRQKALEQREQELASREQQLRATAEQPPAEGAGEDLQRLVQEHSELLLDGDTDAANAKMVEIIQHAGRPQSPTLNMDDLASEVATRVRTKQEQEALDRSVDAGWNALVTDYPDVVGDQAALAYADATVAKLRNDHPDWSPEQVIVESGRVTREVLGLKAPASAGMPTGEATDLTAQRKERKANIRPIPGVSGKRHTQKEPEKVDMTAAGKIARMRAGRATG